MKYPFNYYYYQKIAIYRKYLDFIFKQLGIKEVPRLSERNVYYVDFLEAIKDICDFLQIDLEKFISYYLEHSIWPDKLWKNSHDDCVKFNEQIKGEYALSNICANCVYSFSLKYSYDAIYFLLEKIVKDKNSIKVCDYGCANAHISLAMLLRKKISFLMMCDFHNKSTEFINYRIQKYHLNNNATWEDVRSINYHRYFNEFDIIICFDVLEHTPNPTEILSAKIYPMLKKGGFLVLQAPWGGGVPSHLEDAIFDFYKKGGRGFLRTKFQKIHTMSFADISGIWIKK